MVILKQQTSRQISLASNPTKVNDLCLLRVIINLTKTIIPQTFNLQSDVVPILILLNHSSEKCLEELQQQST